MTPMLSQNFTLAISAWNLGALPYSPVCLLLSPKLLQMLLLAVDLTIAIPFITIFSLGHLETLTTPS